MNLDFSEQIKQRLGMLEVAEYYGFKIERGNRILCPFHDDKSASMVLYSGKRGFFCFACNAGGSVIDFVMRMSGLSFLEACKKLDEDFKLGLNIGAPMDEGKRQQAREAYKRRAEALQRRKDTEKQLWDAYHAAIDQFCALDRMKMEYAPKKGKDADFTIRDEYAYAVKNIDGAWNDVQEAAARLREFELKGEND